MVISVAYITGFDHHTLMEMPFHEFKKWHEDVMAFREDRLQEQVDVLREALQPSADQPDGQRQNDLDPLKGFY